MRFRDLGASAASQPFNQSTNGVAQMNRLIRSFLGSMVLAHAIWRCWQSTRLLTALAAVLGACMALPAAAADNCNVPDFTLTASIIGPVSTKDQALDCAHRQLALAHFGKVAQLQAADANEARSGMWTSNGDAMAREAADLAVKNSVIKAQIDVFAAALGVIGKADSKSAADITQVTLKFTAARPATSRTRSVRAAAVHPPGGTSPTWSPAC